MTEAELNELERLHNAHLDYERLSGRPAITDHEFGMVALPFMQAMPDLIRLARVGMQVESFTIAKRQKPKPLAKETTDE